MGNQGFDDWPCVSDPPHSLCFQNDAKSSDNGDLERLGTSAPLEIVEDGHASRMRDRPAKNCGFSCSQF